MARWMRAVASERCFRHGATGRDSGCLQRPATRYAAPRRFPAALRPPAAVLPQVVAHPALSCREGLLGSLAARAQEPLRGFVRDRARQLLAKASVVPEASGQRLVPKTASPAADSAPPRTAGESTYDYFRRLFFVDSDPRKPPLENYWRPEAELHRGVKTAEEELAKLTGKAKPKESSIPPPARIPAWKGSDPETVAKALMCTQTQVRDWRRAQGFEPETGRPMQMENLPAEQRAEVARAWRSTGASLREIAKRLGVSAMTIQRDLG